MGKMGLTQWRQVTHVQHPPLNFITLHIVNTIHSIWMILCCHLACQLQEGFSTWEKEGTAMLHSKHNATCAIFNKKKVIVWIPFYFDPVYSCCFGLCKRAMFILNLCVYFFMFCFEPVLNWENMLYKSYYYDYFD